MVPCLIIIFSYEVNISSDLTGIGRLLNKTKLYKYADNFLEYLFYCLTQYIKYE